MRPFDSLTDRGRMLRLRALAVAALQQYDLDVTDIRPVGTYTNTLFRVRATDGAAYVLRVCAPGWRTLTDLRSEAMWLRALARDTDIPVPRPQAARDGEYVVQAALPGVPQARHCMVMTWLPGVLLQGDRLTEANLSRMGELFARLHAHAATFEPPEGFTRRRMDTLYARGEEDALFGAACADAFTPRTRDLLERTRARVDDAFRRLYADPAGLRVIHNDLHHGNIKLYRGRLFPFDFEDTVWGYLVQDLAMALQDLMLDVAPAAFEPLQTALRRGYERYSPWPETEEGQIDTLRAGRLLWVANYVARYEGEHLQGFLHRLAGMLERYLDTGRVRKADT